MAENSAELKSVVIFALQNPMRMNNVSINISLPNCGSYSEEELKSILQRFAMYMIKPKKDEIPCCYTEEEVKSLLARRLKEIDDGKAVLIDNDVVFAEAEMLLG